MLIVGRVFGANGPVADLKIETVVVDGREWTRIEGPQMAPLYFSLPAMEQLAAATALCAATMKARIAGVSL